MTSPPVLLVHGFGSSFEANWARYGWVELLEDLGRKVIGVDLLGHGSAAKPTDASAYAQVEDMVQQGRAAEPVVDAVGFSAGGTVLLTLMARYPDTFRRVVLLGVGNSVLSDHVSADSPGEGMVAMKRTMDILLSRAESPDALQRFLERERMRVPKESLSAITADVRLVIGTADGAYPAGRLATMLPNADVTVFEGLDHFSTPSDVRVVGAALDFLARDCATPL